MKVYKRGNHWWFSGTIDGEHTRFSLGPTIRTKENAEKWLADFSTKEEDLTLRTFIKDYLNESRVRLSQRTTTFYRRTLVEFESYFGVDRRLNTITSREISIWAATRLEKGLSPETVNIDLRHVKAALNRAVSWELISKVPKIEMVKAPRRLPRHLSQKQFAALVKAEQSPDFKRLWIFLVWTACRRAEALNLRWEDIALGDQPQALIIGKGDRQRSIPLLPPAFEALGPPKESGLVFTMGKPDYATHRFKKAARAAGIEAKLHDLRHTALTWLVAHGVPLKLVQDIAGHADIKTTMGYAKVYSGGAYKTLVEAIKF